MKCNQVFAFSFNLRLHLTNAVELGIPAPEVESLTTKLLRESSTWKQQDSQEQFDRRALEWLEQNRRHKKKPVESVKPEPPTYVQRFTPCAHWGGTRQCDNCLNREMDEGGLSRAQDLWTGHHLYIKKILHAKGVPESVFDEVDSRVWYSVARWLSQHRFMPRGSTDEVRKKTTNAWLRTIALRTLADFWKEFFAEKRGGFGRDKHPATLLQHADQYLREALETSDPVVQVSVREASEILQEAIQRVNADPTPRLEFSTDPTWLNCGTADSIPERPTRPEGSGIEDGEDEDAA